MTVTISSIGLASEAETDTQASGTQTTAANNVRHIRMEDILLSSIEDNPSVRTLPGLMPIELSEIAMRFAEARSCDPHRKVGAVLVCTDGTVLLGANRLPRGVRNSPTPDMTERPGKYVWIVHAERDLLYAAQRAGLKVEGGTMVVTRFPCHQCAETIEGMGVRRVFAPQPNVSHPRWGAAWQASMDFLDGVGIERQVIHDPSPAEDITTPLSS